MAAGSDAAAASAGPPGVPLLVSLDGQRVVCVGGGSVAAAKALPLLDAGARVTVVSPEATEALAAAADAGRLRWERRRYASGDLAGALLVIAATGSGPVNARVAADAARQPVLCVRVDAGARQPAHEAGPAQAAPAAAGTAAFLAAVRRGPLLLAVSTSGEAPSLARRIRGELEHTYDEAWGACAALLGEVRRVLQGLPAAERRRRWRSLPVLDIVDLLRNDSAADAKDVATACLSSSSD